MNESPIHVELVGKILAWISHNHGAADALCIFRDGSNVTACEKPPLIGSFFPDILAEDTPPTLTIIGEAKTAADLEKSHSSKQFRAFIDYLSFRANPQLVIATPWYVRKTAAAIVSRISSELAVTHVTTTFI